ncbi:hypothetical protein [Kribbella sp. NPDC048928]|uniref:Rv1733c family protein n=1 Tax=Kribbella sp. NPDC048928 TaxID=3364111 RepID=UPI00371684A2
MSTAKQRTGELWVLMQARRLGIGRKNPMRRWSDHAETVLLWCAVIAALMMVPVAAAIGTNISNSLEASAARQRAVLHQVQARTLESADRTIPSTPGDALSRIHVSYADQQGAEREGTTSVVIGTTAGAQVKVWLDQSGAIAPAPRSTSDSAAFGGTAGFFIVFGSSLVLWGLFRLARIPLDRRRLQAWDAEWQAIAPRWPRGQK